MLVKHPLYAAHCQLSNGCDQSRQREETWEVDLVGRLVRLVVVGIRVVLPSGALL